MYLTLPEKRTTTSPVQSARGSASATSSVNVADSVFHASKRLVGFSVVRLISLPTVTPAAGS